MCYFVSVSKAGTATLALGRFLAPHIRRHGTAALSHLVEQSDQKSQKQVRGHTVIPRLTTLFVSDKMCRYKKMSLRRRLSFERYMQLKRLKKLTNCISEVLKKHVNIRGFIM